MADQTRQSPRPASKSKAVLLQASSKLIGLVLQFVFVRFAIRWLGLDQYGIYVFAMSCAAFMGLADFGMPASTQRSLGEALAQNDLVRVASIFRFARRLHTIFAIGALTIFTLFALLFGNLGQGKSTDPTFVLLVLCGVQTAATLFTSPATTMAYALDRFREVAIINVIQGTLTPALGLIVVYQFRTPEALAVTTLTTAVLTSVLAYRLCGSRGLPKAQSLAPAEKKKLLSLGAKTYPMGITTVIGNNADKVMIERAGMADSLASYYVACRVPEQIYQVIFPITTTVYPELTRLAGVNEEAFTHAVERNIRFALALAASFIIVPCAFSDCIMRVWLHNDFVNANPGVVMVLPLMALYRALELVYGVITMAYYAKGVPLYVLPFSLFNASVTVFGTVPMFRWQGIVGVGVMNACIDIAQIVPMTLALKKFAAPGVRLSHVAGGFASVLTIAAGFYIFLHYGLDLWLASIQPLLGFVLAPIAGVAAVLWMTRLGVCEVPDRVAARVSKMPIMVWLLPRRADQLNSN